MSKVSRFRDASCVVFIWFRKLLFRSDRWLYFPNMLKYWFRYICFYRSILLEIFSHLKTSLREINSFVAKTQIYSRGKEQINRTSSSQIVNFRLTKSIK